MNEEWSIDRLRSVGRRLRVVIGCLVLASCALASLAQTADPPLPSGARLVFDIASVRPSRRNASGAEAQPESNVPLGPGDIYSPTGGVLTARNFPLLTYIAFAYRMTDGQLQSFSAQLPEWARTELFEIQARTESPRVTKNELRLMMRALLADRFKLAVHEEVRAVPSYGLLLIMPGVTGPKLRAHPLDEGCSIIPPAPAEPGDATAGGPAETVLGGFPTVCGGILQLPSSAPGRLRLGGRDVRMKLLADSFASWGQLGRPVVDQTGLTGNYDFVLEYTPELRPEAAGGENASSDPGATFRDALRQQLGLRLESQKIPLTFLIFDHVERPTPN